MTFTDTLQRRITRTAVVVAAVFLVMGLAGCLKMDMDISLSGDTVDGSVIMALDKQVLELSGQDVDAMLAGMDADLPGSAGVTSEPYEDDSLVGTKYTFDGVGLDEFNEANESDEDSLSIVHDTAAGTYTLTGLMDLSEFSAEDLDTGGEELGVPPALAGTFLDGFDISISVTFPGEVTEHNGELDGTTVTWKPAAGEATEMRAVAQDSGGSTPTSTALLVGLGVAVLAALGGGGALLIRRRRRRSGQPASAAGVPATGFGTAPGGQADFGTAPPPPGTPGFGAAPGGQGGFGEAPTARHGFGRAPGENEPR